MASQALSANEMTPDSETREMVQVQEELYSMLGITSPGGQSVRLRRSHSMLGLPSAGLSPPPMSAHARYDSGFGVRQRRSSLPGAHALVDAQHAIDADVSIVYSRRFVEARTEWIVFSIMPCLLHLLPSLRNCDGFLFCPVQNVLPSLTLIIHTLQCIPTLFYLSLCSNVFFL